MFAMESTSSCEMCGLENMAYIAGRLWEVEGSALCLVLKVIGVVGEIL